MAETRTMRKWFWVWDFEKEEEWLNDMALNGWVLAGVDFCTYHFVRCEPGEYTVRLEMHPADDAYIAFLEEQLETPICIVSIGPDRSQTIVRQ